MWIVAIISAGLFFTLALSYYGSLQITAVPPFAVPYTPDDLGWTYENVSFQSTDGLRLTGWFVPAAVPSSTTIIVNHGLGSNHGDMLLNTACLQREGRWNLLYYNFRGHADSEGKLTSLGPLELLDLDAALRFLKEQKPEQSRRLAIYGHSLGAAVAIVGAVQHPELIAVAAESPFASISRTVQRFAQIYHGIPYFPFVPGAIFITSLRLGIKMGYFDPVEAIGKIAPRPLLLIQAGNDVRMPMSDFQLLWDAAREPKERFVVPGADHGDPWIIDKDGYEKHLVEFFRKALP